MQNRFNITPEMIVEALEPVFKFYYTENKTPPSFSHIKSILPSALDDAYIGTILLLHCEEDPSFTAFLLGSLIETAITNPKARDILGLFANLYAQNDLIRLAINNELRDDKVTTELLQTNKAAFDHSDKDNNARDKFHAAFAKILIAYCIHMRGIGQLHSLLQATNQATTAQREIDANLTKLTALQATKAQTAISAASVMATTSPIFATASTPAISSNNAADEQQKSGLSSLYILGHD